MGLTIGKRSAHSLRGKHLSGGVILSEVILQVQLVEFSHKLIDERLT